VKTQIRIFSIAAVLSLVSANVFAQEATATTTDAATATVENVDSSADAKVTPDTDISRFDLVLVDLDNTKRQLRNTQNSLEVSDALRRFHATQNRFDQVDREYETLKLELRLNRMQGQTDANTAAIADIKDKSRGTVLTLSGGYSYGFNGPGVPTLRAAFDFIPGKPYAEYLPGQGFGGGLEGIGSKIGPADLRFIGVGFVLNNDPNKPMYNTQLRSVGAPEGSPYLAEPHKFDLRFNIASAEVDLYKGFGIGARLSMLVGPKVAVDRAKRVIDQQDTSSSNLDPNGIIGSINPNDPNSLNTAKNQAQQDLNDQVSAKADEAKGTAEETVNQFGGVFKDAFETGWRLDVFITYRPKL
jgi:hypothetical protein